MARLYAIGVGLLFMVATCSSLVAAENEETIFVGGDELSRIYHEWPGSAPRNRDTIVDLLAREESRGNPFFHRAREVFRERDGFRRNDNANKIYQEYLESLSPLGSRTQIHVITTVRIEDYDFSRKEYRVCWADNSSPCSKTEKIQRSTGKYVLTIDMPRPNGFGFTQTEEKARKFERDVSEAAGRLLKAILVVQIDDVSYKEPDSKWSPEYFLSGKVRSVVLVSSMYGRKKYLRTPAEVVSAPRLIELDFSAD